MWDINFNCEAEKTMIFPNLRETRKCLITPTFYTKYAYHKWHA